MALSPCSWCLSWCCCSSYTRSCALLGSSSLATWQRTGRTARINGKLRQISVVFRLDQWPNVRNLGANPLQMAWQRQIKWGEDRQMYINAACIVCVAACIVCGVCTVALRPDASAGDGAAEGAGTDGRGWCLAKASEGRGRVGTTCPISTHSQYPQPH